MTAFAASSASLSDAAFDEISRFVKTTCGINLHDGKKELVKARLAKRMRSLGIRSYDEYIEHVREDADGRELTAMLDVISTNLTYFFRESRHFDYLREAYVPAVIASGRRRLRIWSAGCSSGEEPYTIAMVLSEAIADLHAWDAAILATDLSTAVLATARAGAYRPERFRDVPRGLVSRYFSMLRTGGEAHYRVNESLRRLVHFARLNLMDTWPMRGPFDVIFCRNVMIYFDKDTQAALVNRYFDILAPGGLLMLGHSESLTGVRHRFRYVQPAVYQRP